MGWKLSALSLKAPVVLNLSEPGPQLLRIFSQKPCHYVYMLGLQAKGSLACLYRKLNGVIHVFWI